MFSTKVLNVLAVVATLCFAVVVALQVAELLFYKQPPSAWPVGP